MRVAAVSTAGEYLLPASLAAFISHQPAVDLRLEVGSSERPWGLFAAHEADLVIGGRPPGHVGDAVVRAVRPNLQQQILENKAQVPLMESALTAEKGLFQMSLDNISGPQYEALSRSGIRDLPPVSRYVTLEILTEAYQGAKSLPA